MSEPTNLYTVDKEQFKERWSKAVKTTYQSHHALIADSEHLAKLATQFYKSIERKRSWWRILHWSSSTDKKCSLPKIAKKICGLAEFLFLTNEEYAYWHDPLVKKLFEIWQDNLQEQRERGGDAESKERRNFLKYMFELYEEANNPSMEVTKLRDYKQLAHALNMLRPNNIAHIYISYPFSKFPIKSMIKQYLEIAATTGQYDVLLRRFSPYYNMLKMYATPGKWTFCDLRNGIDRRPLTIPLNLEYKMGIFLPKTHTRKHERFIKIPVKHDAETETHKQAEIKELRQKLEYAFEHPSYLGNIDIVDGEICYMGNETPEPIPNYGARRTSYLHIQDELNLFEAISPPSPDTGLKLSFNLREPLAVLLDGVNYQHPVKLKDILYLLRCLPPYLEKRKQNKDLSHQQAWEQAIEDTGVDAQVTNPFLKDIEDCTKKPNTTEEDVWQYLSKYLIEGQQPDLLMTICNLLSDQGFDVLFSLFPLLKGKNLELEIGTSDDEITEKSIPIIKTSLDEVKKEESEEEEEQEDEQEIVQSQKNNTTTKHELPMLHIIQEQIENLLHDVFTKHVDISAGTKDKCSEPRLAELVVMGCLNLQISVEQIKKDLYVHLCKHRLIYENFNRDLSCSGVECDHIEKLDDSHKQQVITDVNDIVALIEKTRERLLSREMSNRLLCFLDPKSVEVLTGDFEYIGKEIEKEESFIKDRLERTREQEELKNKNEHELKQERQNHHLEENKRREQLEAREQEHKYKIKITEIEKQEQKEHAEAQKDIAEYRREELFANLDSKVPEALQRGNLQAYAKLAIAKAHQESGIDGVENLLSKSPNIFSIIDKEAYSVREKHKHKEDNQKLKQQILDIIKEDPEKFDSLSMSVMMSVLFDQDIKNALDAEHQRLSTEAVLEAVKHNNLTTPFIPGMTPVIDTNSTVKTRTVTNPRDSRAKQAPKKS